MGRRGPIPTPIDVAKRKGVKMSRQVEGPDITISKPACPKWLSDDARKVFRSVVRGLVEFGMIHRVDQQSIARYATLVVRHREIEDDLIDNGHMATVEKECGTVTFVRQEVWLAARLEKQILSLEKELFLTPASRVRLPTSKRGKKRKSNLQSYGEAKCTTAG